MADYVPFEKRYPHILAPKAVTAATPPELPHAQQRAELTLTRAETDNRNASVRLKTAATVVVSMYAVLLSAILLGLALIVIGFLGFCSTVGTGVNRAMEHQPQTTWPTH